MRKSKKFKPLTTLIALETWDFGMYVFINSNVEDAKKYLKGFKHYKTNDKIVLENYEEFLDNELQAGLAVEVTNDLHRTHALFIKDAYDNWKFWDRLLHETSHKTMHLLQNKSAWEEPEAVACTQEAMFRVIREKLK